MPTRLNRSNRLTRSLATILLLSSVVTICFAPSSSGQQFTTSGLTGLTTISPPVTFHLFAGLCYFAFLPLFNTTGTFNITYSITPDFVTLTVYVLDAPSYSSWQATFASGQSANMAQNRCYPANYSLVPSNERTINGGGILTVTLSSFSMSSGNRYGIVLTDVDLVSGPPTASISVGPVQS